LLFSLPHLASYPRNILLYCFSFLIEVMLRNVIDSLVYYIKDLIFSAIKYFMTHSVPGTEWQVAVSCLKLPLISPPNALPT
jgi:hypothetical protein